MQTKLQTARSRKLRADSTDAERKLWSILRNRQLMGVKFRRQVPIGRYFADFACVSARVVVELDGGQHEVRVEYDVERTRALEIAGWHVIRFWNNALQDDSDGVARDILAALELARG